MARRPRKPGPSAIVPAPAAPAPAQGSRYLAAFNVARGLGTALREGLRLDTWANAITGLGGSRDRSRGMQIHQFRPLSFDELDAMYHGQDLPATIVDRLPTDAMSGGFQTGDEALDRACARWMVRDRILEGRIWGRLYGCGGVVIGTSRFTTGPMDSPLEFDRIKVGDLEYLWTVDRQDLAVAETDQNPDSPTYGDPRMYRVGMQNVHPSRVVLFGGARTSPTQRARTGGWDLSVLQRPYDVLCDTEQSWRSVMNLVQDMSQSVFAVKGLMEMIAEGKKSVIMERMEVVDIARTVARSVVIDAEDERYEHVGAANVTGIDPILMRVFQRLAAATGEYPLSILLGMSASGLNATGAGDSDLKIYDKRVTGERTLLEPSILFLAAVVAAHEGLDLPGSVSWPSLYEPTDAERAATDKIKADTAAVRITAAITDATEEARILSGERLEDVLAERPEAIPDLGGGPEAIEVEDEADALIATPIGSAWTDTVDGHRIQVTGVGMGRVYCVDLDGENPAQQWSWTKRGFLDRCSRRAA